jgi:hypothetical protein
VAVDGYTGIQWLLGENDSPWVNTGNAGTLSLGKDFGTPTIVNSPLGASPTAVNSNNGTCRLGSGYTSVGEYTNTLSVSFWVKLDSFSSSWAAFVDKSYRADNSWTGPWESWGIGISDSNNGRWYAGVAFGVSSRTVILITDHMLSLNAWYLLSMTYDASLGLLKVYMNGSLVGTEYTTPGTPVSYGTHGQYSVLGDQGNGTSKATIWDVRVENTIRSQAYYADQYNKMYGMNFGLYPACYALINTTYNTSINKFGNASLDFNGTSSVLEVNICDTVVNAGFEEWTIETWVYPRAFNASGSAIFYQDYSAGLVGVYLKLESNGVVTAYMGTDTTFVSVQSSAISLNTWSHVAIQREFIGTTDQSCLALYVNGTKYSTGSLNYNITRFYPVLRFGKYYTGSVYTYLDGCLDEIRITTGRKVYSTAFDSSALTVFPDAAFPANPGNCEVRKSTTGEFYICANASANTWRMIKFINY